MRWIGVDESGKGDYFGYLVIAGVVVDDETAKKLRGMGVKDSKKLSDIAVQSLAKDVKRICKNEVVKISPEKYNQLYLKFKNLNKLLAWGHARVIENLIEKNEIDHVIVDKFADEKVLNDALKEKSKGKKVIQNIRGESDMAVAAASIIARAEFLRTLRALSLQVGVRLPKGAAHLDDAIKEIKGKYSDDVFSTIAKLHFKTTKKVIGK